MTDDIFRHIELPYSPVFSTVFYYILIGLHLYGCNRIWNRHGCAPKTAFRKMEFPLSKRDYVKMDPPSTTNIYYQPSVFSLMDSLKLESQRPTVIVSLPANDIKYAKAAIEAGADAVKVHLNATHRATGVEFGTLEEERKQIEAIADLDVPVGIVPGQNVGTIRMLLPELETLGINFIDAFAHHLPPETKSVTGLQTWTAPTSEYSQSEINSLGGTDVDAVELSLFPKDSYGTPLSNRAFARYLTAADEITCPTILPTQLDLTPQDAQLLACNGLTNFLLGSIVIGDTVDSIRKSTASFVDALKKDALM